MCVYTKVQKDGSKQRQFCFYKDATTFKNHEASASHKEALQVVVVLRKFVSRASKKKNYGLTNLKMLPLPLDLMICKMAIHTFRNKYIPLPELMLRECTRPFCGGGLARETTVSYS